MLHIHNVDILNICMIGMKELGAKIILLQNDTYERLDIFSDISLDILKELSVRSFAQILLKPSFQN